jgi:hypothetical protein
LCYRNNLQACKYSAAELWPLGGKSDAELPHLATALKKTMWMPVLKWQQPLQKELTSTVGGLRF